MWQEDIINVTQTVTKDSYVTQTFFFFKLLLYIHFYKLYTVFFTTLFDGNYIIIFFCLKKVALLSLIVLF